jgi:hypothetical protein
MTRCLARLLCFTVLMGLAFSAAAFPRQPVTEWIRDLYTAQALRVAQGHTLEENEALALFTPQLAALWEASHKGRELSALPEQGLDAFFGWRVPLGTKVSFTAVIKVLGTAEAPTLLIDVVVAGVPRRVVLDALQDGMSWRVDNVTYDEGGDFASFERKLARP